MVPNAFGCNSMITKRLALLAGISMLAGSAFATDGGQKPKDIANMSLEDLLKVEVTTAGKEAQPYQKVPAAIYVVTAEEIRRSGARNIPEALQLVPGVHVAQLSADQWQISIRGFESHYVDKLLVLIDGRSVYNTTFSGVYWDTQETIMDDIDRIEVVRGPGGSLWGTNAVNGIVNVITKKASATQGTLVSVRSSTVAPWETSVRSGGQFGSAGFFRVYARATSAVGFTTDMGTPANDGWQDIKAGFRADWTGKTDSLMMTGGANSEHLGGTRSVPTYTPPFSTLISRRLPASDLNLTGRWQRTNGYGQGAEVLAYYGHEDRDDPGLNELHDVFNVDLQVPFQVTATNRVTTGFGYRSTRDSYVSGMLATISPTSLTETLLSGFLHGDWKLSSSLALAAGAKVEHNRYTGWEIQPNASIAWTPNRKQTVWAAVSRAVRTPSAADESMTINALTIPAPGGVREIQIVGSSNFRSEAMVSNEIGWRYASSERLLLDATAFYNQYTRLRSFAPGTPYPANGVLVLPQNFANDLGATTAGFELAARYHVTPDWQLEGTYSLCSERFYFSDGVPDFVGIDAFAREGATPHNQIGLRSQLNFTNRFEFDGSIKYTEGVAVNNVAPYARVDCRLGWRPSATTEVSLGGQNLFASNHREALSVFTEPDFIPRNFYVKVNFKF
ncbi:MAG TPA: TonB-dependent receptor [Fimbriimonadaceae bacterium]|nr:TonB-dependent receptor [Fimbriimonadaceae bacterium]